MKAMFLQVATRTMNNGHKEELVCRTCRNSIHDGDIVLRIEDMLGYCAEGRAVYLHKECALPKCYHSTERKYNITGTDNTTWWRLGDISFEIEMFSEEYGNHLSEAEFINCVNNDEAFASLYISTLAIGSKKSGNFQESTRDASVTAETPVRNRSLQSASKWIYSRNEEELRLLHNENCGAHIHVNSNHTGRPMVYYIYLQVLRRIEEMGSEDRIKYFGSDFRFYAGDCVGDDHYCAINIEPSTNCTIEFRLSRIISPEQYIQCCKWWRATVQVVNKWYYKVAEASDDDRRKAEAVKLGKKAAKQVDRMMAGAFRKGE